MEVSETTPTKNLQKKLIDQEQDNLESDECDQSQNMTQLRIDRVNSAPEHTQVNIIEQDEVKVDMIEDDHSDQGPNNRQSHHLKRHTDLVRGKQFQSVNPNQGSQFRSILKSSKNNTTESFLVRVDANGNEIKPKKKGEQKPLHKITFNQQIEEVNVVENWKQYNTDVTSEPGCGCNLI